MIDSVVEHPHDTSCSLKVLRYRGHTCSCLVKLKESALYFCGIELQA